MNTELYKCGECEKSFYVNEGENAVCPSKFKTPCHPGEVYKLEMNNSRTNWAYVDACFKNDGRY